MDTPEARGIDIRPVDITDDRVLGQVYDVITRAEALGREGMPHWSRAEFTAAMRSPDSGERFELVAAHAAGPDGAEQVVGTAVVFLWLLDNLDKAWVEVHVDPVHARQGLGGALLEHVVAIAEDDGRTVVVLGTKVPLDQPDHGYLRFAERHGFTHSNVEVVRHAPLPIREEDLRRWEQRAAERASGYELRTLVDEVDADLSPSLGRLMGQLGVDAPTGEVDFEEEQITHERLVERLDAVRAMGRELLETVALDEHGTVVAQSTLVAPPDSPDAWQWGTFVDREHRGHRLGLAVKARNVRVMQERHPHLRRIVTQNGETNEWMISINVLMGFVAVEHANELVRRRSAD